MARTALEGFGRSLLETDEVVMAAIGDIARFRSPQKLVSYVGLNPRVRQSGLGAEHQGRISKVGRSHARVMLVEAAWAAAKALGPLHASFEFGPDAAIRLPLSVAVARKLTVLCWHLLTKETDYLWVRPSLVAHKVRSMELQAGKRSRKGSKPGPSHAYHKKGLRYALRQTITRRCTVRGHVRCQGEELALAAAAFLRRRRVQVSYEELCGKSVTIDQRRSSFFKTEITSL